jgi:hypothetical protein
MAEKTSLDTREIIQREIKGLEAHKEEICYGSLLCIGREKSRSFFFQSKLREM